MVVHIVTTHIGGACSKYELEEIDVRYLVKKPSVKQNLENLDVEERMKSKWILQE
jgi:hypothetical protein